MTDDKRICPSCSSDNIVEILWGASAYDKRLQQDHDKGRVALGGCCISVEGPECRCNDCGYEFGATSMSETMALSNHSQQLKAVVYGAAVGDALGVPYEFMGRDSFECKGMASGGAHQVLKGTFSDDTSLMLATCDSIRACDGIDVDDMRKRFCDWLYQEKYTADGHLFDVGNATATALDQGYGCKHERSNGNGSLMRIAPLALTDAIDDEIRAVSAITHAHPLSTEACVSFVRILRDVLASKPLVDAIDGNIPDEPEFEFMHEIARWTRDDVSSGGFVLDTLGAALWCGVNFETYSECMLAAVNLGWDTDTTACVAGALAGAMYGCESICEDWFKQLRGKEVIDVCLF